MLAQPTHFVFDDAYFYLQIADHVARGHGSTFDGVTTTNGYHPLWLAVCVPLLALANATGWSGLHLVLALQLGLTLAAAVLYARWVRRVALPAPVVSLAYTGSFLMTGGLWISEGPVALLLELATLLLLLDAHARPHRTAKWIYAGLAAGSMVLARLDLVFLAAACCLSPLLQGGAPARARLRRAAWLGLACALPLAPYLLFNLLDAGHVVPISGALKSAFPTPDLRDVSEKLGRLGVNTTVGSALCLALAFTVRRPLRGQMLLLATGALCQSAYVAAFTTAGWATHCDYYWVTGALCTAIAASVACGWLVRLRPLRTSRRSAVFANLFAACVAAAGLLAAASRALVPGPGALAWSPEPATVRLARWMRATLPADARIFTVDAPGRLAWFSRRPVLAADGLTRDRGFSAALRRPDLQAWLARSRVTHIVAPLHAYRMPWAIAEQGGGVTTLTVLAPADGEAAGRIDLPARLALALPQELAEADVGLWRWPLE